MWSIANLNVEVGSRTILIESHLLKCYYYINSLIR